MVRNFLLVPPPHSKISQLGYLAVADLGGVRGACPPPFGAQILSISCSFQENLAKSYVGAPPWGNPGSAAVWQYYMFPERVGAYPTGIPGSAPAFSQKLAGCINNWCKSNQISHDVACTPILLKLKPDRSKFWCSVIEQNIDLFERLEIN